MNSFTIEQVGNKIEKAAEEICERLDEQNMVLRALTRVIILASPTLDTQAKKELIDTVSF